MFNRLSTSDASLHVSPSVPSSYSSQKMAYSFSSVAKIFHAFSPRRHASSDSEEDSDNAERYSSIPPRPLSSTMITTTAATTGSPFGHLTPRGPPSTPKRTKRHPSEATTTSSASTSGAPSPTSPSSPSGKSYYIHLSSGDSPISHPGIAEAACERREPIERTDTYLCTGGVNIPVLLRMTRTDLMDIASVLGANALIEEQWKCAICGPKSRSKLTYKVRIHYKARATRSTLVDPHQPVASDQTHGIPGLMTVVRLNDD
ncbi:hypothetical protein AX15_004431 [Amanita polypyramis BW_CC]|nr:hypothetical protein AX15_004431 [Amanita polypyramis BW_CC]